MAAYRQAAYADAGRAARSRAVCSGGERQEAARVELPQPVLAVELPQRAWRRREEESSGPAALWSPRTARASSGPGTVGGAGELSVWEGSSESGGVEPRREEHSNTQTGADVQRDRERGYFGHLR